LQALAVIAVRLSDPPATAAEITTPRILVFGIT
jgi:hypothetical protein